MSKPWGTVGAWALDAERAEAEERERAASEESTNPVLAGQPPQSFPSLKEAASTKIRKKKPATMSLAEFTTGSYPGPGAARREAASLEPKGLTPDEMLRLPTGPRERSADELEQGRLGGGFRSYGSGTGPRGGRRLEEGDGRRGFGGGFDDDLRRRPPSGALNFDQPSRADEVDNWAAAKKTSSFGPPPGEYGRQDRYSSLGGGSSSRADDVDNWSVGKKPVVPTRHSSYGSGFRDISVDRWGSALPTNGERERRRLVLDPPKGNVGAPVEAPGMNRPSPFGAARPREEVLAEKGVDWRKMDSEIEVKQIGRPVSSHSSRPSSAHSSRPGTPGSSQVAAAVTSEGALKPRQKVNPFGDAKPREVLLEEKGKDWRKIDLELEHHSVDRPETHEEKLLKEEISNLKKSLTKENEGNFSSATHASEESARIQEQIAQKERDLELLVRDSDDKVRFGQRATIVVRPGSGAGRMGTSFERPHSHSGWPEESSSMDKRSQYHVGNEDTWPKHVERRHYQDSRGSSFYGNRDIDRPRSRERW